MVSKQAKVQHVIIKGTKDGITFILDDQCSLEMLKVELQEKLSERPEILKGGQGPVKAKIDIGKRYLDADQVEEFVSMFSDEMNIQIDDIESEVISKEDAEEMKRNKQINRIVKIVRSGQVLTVTGDLLLIGDVNPGATVKATGNIYILGRLRGVAHAGYNGDTNAIICASSMMPSQLRIASIIRRPPEKTEEEQLPEDIECAYLNNEGDMILDKLQTLVKVRPNLSMEFDD